MQPMAAVALAALFAAAAPSARAQTKQLLFDAPKEASEEDRKTAAKALAARCVAQGMTGVKAEAIHRGPGIPKQIRLSAPKEFTPEMISAIDFLASFQGRDLELRFDRRLSEAEKEKYPVEVNAPEGHSWIRLRDWETVDGRFMQLKPAKQELCYVFPDKPGLKLAGKVKIHRHGGGDLFGEFSAPGTFLIYRDALAQALFSSIIKNPDAPDRTLIPSQLLLDGHRIPTEDGRIHWRTLKPAAKSKTPDMALWEFPASGPGKVLAYLLEHPLPCALKRIE